MANKKPSLYKQNANQKHSLYKQNRNRRRNSRERNEQKDQIIAILKLILLKIILAIEKLVIWIKKNPKKARNVFGIAFIILIILFLAMSLSSNNNAEIENPPSTLIGNNSIGTVSVEGPYGNGNSDIKIAYILGVHPREEGAHRLMEEALKNRSSDLNKSYYLYKINVTSDSTNFDQSRINGQILAQEYAVPDMIENNYTAAVDVHYSNGYWGVSRFVFTPRENNTLSNQLAHAIADNFEWLSYYVPPDPTSPTYVTEPLNDGGVASLIYEAYTGDSNNVTLEHDKEIIDFIDNWDFDNQTKSKSFLFF